MSRGMKFQSTPSTQRETAIRQCMRGVRIISIHSLYAEGDQRSRDMFFLLSSFQSTPSTQRETAKINKILYSNPKNIVENTKLYISNTQQHTCRAHYPLPNYLSASANLPEIPCSLRIRTRTFPRQALLLA